jgi:hypothetical protein
MVALPKDLVEKSLWQSPKLMIPLFSTHFARVSVHQCPSAVETDVFLPFSISGCGIAFGFTGVSGDT